jgi:hypothetical protein
MNLQKPNSLLLPQNTVSPVPKYQPSATNILLQSIIQTYNKLGKKELERHTKTQLIKNLLIPFFSYDKLKKEGIKLAKKTYLKYSKTSTDFTEKKYPLKKFTLYQKEERKIEEFLKNHSKPAANKTVKRKGIIHPVRYFEENVTTLFRKYKDTMKENPLTSKTISSSFFRNTIIKLKHFKKPKKITDKCSICEDGKEYTRKLESLYKKNSSEKVKIDQLEKSIKIYKQHKVFADHQREFFNNSKRNLGSFDCLMIFDFKENISLQKGPIETDKNFYLNEKRTIFGITIYFKDNTKAEIQKKHFIFISNILTHDNNFVINAFETLFKREDFTFKNIKLFCDCGPHFRNSSLLHYFFSHPSKKFTLNFFCEKHGKNPLDSLFSLLSRWKKDIEFSKKIETDSQLIEYWNEKLKYSNEDIEPLNLKIIEIKTILKEHNISTKNRTKKCELLNILIENSKNNLNLKNQLDKLRPCPKKPLNVEFIIMKKFERDFYPNILIIEHLKDYYHFSKNENEIQCGIFSEKIVLSVPFNSKTINQKKNIKKSVVIEQKDNCFGKNSVLKYERQLKIVKNSNFQDITKSLKEKKEIDDDIVEKLSFNFSSLEIKENTPKRKINELNPNENESKKVKTKSKNNDNIKRKIENDNEKSPKKPKIEQPGESLTTPKLNQLNENKIDEKQSDLNLSNRDKRMMKRNEKRNEKRNVESKIDQDEEIEMGQIEIGNQFVSSIIQSLKHMTFSEKLKKLNCKENESISNGDCGFFSILKLLNLNISTFELRTKVINYYKENMSLLKNKLNQLRDNHRTYTVQNNEDYLNIMSKDKVWMTNLEILCIAKMFKKNILVLDMRPNLDTLYNESPDKDFIIMCYNGVNHWTFCTQIGETS